MLLGGERIDAPIKRLIIAEDLFERAETGVDAAIWQVFSKIGRSLPQAERNIVAGAHLSGWRDAFRVIQGFEIQSTLLPFIRSHKVELGPGIKERFDMAAAIGFAEAEAAREVRAEIADRLHFMAKPGSVIALPTTPTLPPERGIPDGASFAEFRTGPWALPVLAAMAACRRSRFRPTRRPVALSGCRSSAGRAATRNCSIWPSGLSLS